MHALYADENMSRRVSDALKKRGVDVIQCVIDKIVPQGLADHDHLDKALEMERVFLTGDIASVHEAYMERQGRGIDCKGILFVHNNDSVSDQVAKILNVLRRNEGRSLDCSALWAGQP